MTRKPIPFTIASLARAMKAVKLAGSHVIGIRPDGTLILADNPIDTAGFCPAKGTDVVDPREADLAVSWDDFR
ncbi:hypothetical protein [Bradyrhizobium cenepequi]